jgi:hypothetical protein
MIKAAVVTTSSVALANDAAIAKTTTIEFSTTYGLARALAHPDQKMPMVWITL